MITIFFILISFANSHDFSAHLAEALINARSLTELNLFSNDYRRLNEAVQLCKLQLESKSLPNACYEQLDLENSLKISNLREITAKRQTIDEICVSVAKKSQEIKIEMLSKFKMAGQNCQKAIVKAYCQHNYMKKRTEPINEDYVDCSLLD